MYSVDDHVRVGAVEFPTTSSGAVYIPNKSSNAPGSTTGGAFFFGPSGSASTGGASSSAGAPDKSFTGSTGGASGPPVSGSTGGASGCAGAPDKSSTGSTGGASGTGTYFFAASVLSIERVKRV